MVFLKFLFLFQRTGIKSYSCWTSAKTELNDACKALWPLASLKGTHLITWYLPGKLETILNLRKILSTKAAVILQTLGLKTFSSIKFKKVQQQVQKQATTGTRIQTRYNQ